MRKILIPLRFGPCRPGKNEAFEEEKTNEQIHEPARAGPKLWERAWARSGKGISIIVRGDRIIGIAEDSAFLDFAFIDNSDAAICSAHRLIGTDRKRPKWFRNVPS